jgi:hypothetical protein
VLDHTNDAAAAAGEEAIYCHMNLTWASNARAKVELGFMPRPLLWAESAGGAWAYRRPSHTIDLTTSRRVRPAPIHERRSYYDNNTSY